VIRLRRVRAGGWPGLRAPRYWHELVAESIGHVTVNSQQGCPRYWKLKSSHSPSQLAFRGQLQLPWSMVRRGGRQPVTIQIEGFSQTRRSDRTCKIGAIFRSKLITADLPEGAWWADRAFVFRPQQPGSALRERSVCLHSRHVYSARRLRAVLTRVPIQTYSQRSAPTARPGDQLRRELSSMTPASAR